MSPVRPSIVTIAALWILEPRIFFSQSVVFVMPSETRYSFGLDISAERTAAAHLSALCCIDQSSVVMIL